MNAFPPRIIRLKYYIKGVFGWKEMKGKEREGFEGRNNPLLG